MTNAVYQVLDFHVELSLVGSLLGKVEGVAGHQRKSARRLTLGEMLDQHKTLSLTV